MEKAKTVVDCKNAMSIPLMTDSVKNLTIESYLIACGEMRHAVEEMRTVFLQYGSKDGIILCGELLDIGETSSVNLACVLLEFALVESSKQRNHEAIELNETNHQKHGAS
jgi:hypothetical protein